MVGNSVAEIVLLVNLFLVFAFLMVNKIVDGTFFKWMAVISVFIATVALLYMISGSSLLKPLILV